MNTTRTLRASVMALTVSLAAGAASAQDAAPMIEPWGFPLENLDRSIDPGDDFFQFAHGRWLDTVAIPSDRSGTGFSIEMRDRNDARFAEIIQAAIEAEAPDGSDRQKIADLYLSFMDVEAIEARGLEPIQPGLARIAAAGSHADIAALIADPVLGLSGPFGAGVGIDQKNPTTYNVSAGHGGLAMPDRDYYLLEDARFEEARAAYRAHVYRMLSLIGYEDPLNAAASVLMLEIEIAKLHWPRAERRDADRTYNPMSVAELADYAPDYPWRAHLEAAGVDVDQIVVREKEAFPGLARLFAETPIETWRAYLAYRHVNGLAGQLPDAIYQESFDFYGRALSGQTEPRARDKRGISLVNSRLNQVLGRVYIEEYFPESAKAEATEMFENIRAALAERIQRLDWMSAETKVKAQAKLEAMNAKIAYPDKWLSYEGLDIRADDLAGNVMRARAYEHERSISRLGTSVDKEEWFTGPQIVNAFYSPTRNEAFMPAGYLQPPLFDPNADPAINYGAIGSIVGHEIGHGFDDQGSKYAADGKLENWWTEEDRAAFDAAGAALAEQYSQFEPLPGLNVRGPQTLGENLADLLGMLVAYEGYLKSLDGQEAPVLDGFTGAQRFFLGRAQARRYLRTEESLRQRLVSGVHSPMRYRVNGVIRNMDVWYDAYEVTEDDDLYLAPEDRVRAW